MGAMLKGLRSYSDNLIDGYKFKFDKLENLILKLNKMDPFQILKEFPIIGKI